MDLLKPELGLLFWMLIAFGVVFFVLAKFGFPVIVKMVEERKTFIDKSLESAKEANARLSGIVAESEKILKDAREQEIYILKEADGMKAQVIAEAKQQASIEAGKLLTEARTAIQKEKEMALRDVRNEIAALSLGIAEKILRKNLSNQPDQRELVDKLIDEARIN
ncbi:MAG: F0F1 ATP synthase subunit B [Dysgonamonadaceae bacterium]|jgi:F-type H+-transporting ATPase subunit b|nr:F0F1 ATP synthase subunit B [Dysgonamonadaceae bacterium]